MKGGTLHDVTFSEGKMNNHVDYRLTIFNCVYIGERLQSDGRLCCCLCMVAILIVSHCVLLNRKYSFIYIYINTGESLLSACVVALETERLQ